MCKGNERAWYIKKSESSVGILNEENWEGRKLREDMKLGK